ncbi:hypothetical protein Tco_0429788 [Tanacetum coccineum]
MSEFLAIARDQPYFPKADNLPVVGLPIVGVPPAYTSNPCWITMSFCLEILLVLLCEEETSKKVMMLPHHQSMLILGIFSEFFVRSDAGLGTTLKSSGGSSINFRDSSTKPISTTCIIFGSGSISLLISSTFYHLRCIISKYEASSLPNWHYNYESDLVEKMY